MKKIAPIFLFTALSLVAFATHNRAGEITYQCLGGYDYKITVTTYCRINSPADRCDLMVYFGDGDSSSAPRINGPVTSNCSPNGDGQQIAPDIRLNIYVTYHTYPGDGQYYIYMYDPNRNSGVVNIANSVNTPFFLRSFLKINSLLGACNSSPVLTIPPIDNGCLYKCFYHNPGAVDPDGTDSLSYDLTLCLGYGGQAVQSFSDPYYPANVSVDPVTGTLTWCTPQPAPAPFTGFPQEYNFAMLIKEWRKLNNVWYMIGYVERDLQVDINNCPNNPPLIANVNDTCVLAGDTLNFQVIATDIDNDFLTLEAFGEPFLSTSPLATFTPLQTQSSPQPDTAIFDWRTNCDMVRDLPYWVIFKATDSDQNNPLVFIKTIAITVVAPPPLNLTATPNCDKMILSWSPSGCDPNPDHVMGYKVYRLNTCDSWVHSDCETGVPSYTGYTWIGSTVGVNATTFTDDNGGNGLSHGVTYAYHVVAVMIDGAESYASNRVCAELVRDVPIMTNVDVTSTSTTTGTIDVKWVSALPTPGNLDTLAHHGPYTYHLYRNVGCSNANALIATFTRPNFLGVNGISSVTSYTDVNLNTDGNQYVYNIQLIATNGSGYDSLCRAKEASSVFATCVPNDNIITLNWTACVPWTNYKFLIYRAVPSLTIPFTLIDSTTALTFTDDSLVNGRTYCYKIKAYGQYSDTSITRPLINWSQERCCSPIDLTPPCAPILNLASDCDAELNALTWNDPNTSCTGTDDVVAYNIYYTPVQGGDFILIANIPSANILSYMHDSLSSIAGCYEIAAVDSFGNQSAFSNQVCADNCPVYELPNVFTPNGDGQNDQFIPFPYRYVKDIKLQIFNRWGGLVFTTEDPAIHWDGVDMTSKQLLSDGVYFYVCVVNEIHLDGIKPRTLKGFVQILQHKQ